MLKKIILFWSFILVALAALVLFFELDTVSRQQEETIMILRGQNAFQIANDLKAEGYIKSKTVFLFRVASKGDLRQLKAGKYDLKELNEDQIIEQLVSGRTVAANATIIPGWTIKDIGLALAANKIAKADDFTKVVGADAIAELKNEYDFLDSLPQGADLEGFLTPDTYELPDGAEASDLVKLALDNFGKNFDKQMRNDVLSGKRTIFEIVAMASLLEKEVRTFEDKKIVAGILWKRREAGMPLQVDSALLYYRVPGADTGAINKDSESRYNTYRYSGLPIGPICNPGLESIEAAIYPLESEYWFYLSKPDGTTVFSKNYGDHLINKAKYLDNL